jgi:hypothetical protein
MVQYRLRLRNTSSFATASPAGRPVDARMTLLDHLRERPECDALAVRKAAPSKDRRPLTEPEHEFVSEPRLADPGCADDGHDAAPFLNDRPLQRPLQLREGILTANEGSHRPGRNLRWLRGGDQQWRHLIPFALELQRREARPRPTPHELT